MSVPNFVIKDHMVPSSGDLILLPYLNDKIPLFFEGTVKLPFSPKTHSDPGGDLILFRGLLDGRECLVKSSRLDKKGVEPQQVLKEKIASSLKCIEDQGLKRLVIVLDREGEGDSRIDFLASSMEGALLGGYRFDKYLSKKSEPPQVVCITGEKLPDGIQVEFKRLEGLFKWVNRARDILNEPPTIMNPVSLADTLSSYGEKAGLDVTVWDEKRLREEKMNAILAVGSGSARPPRLVIGEYRSHSSKAHLILVGKGVTFDTGGYCLKPADAQMGMKYDMGGAAAAFCAACAIGEAKLEIDVTVMVPLCENAISSTAYKTSDIIVTRSGKSVQVDNTDAEGRLILADTLSLAAEKQPDWIIDVATLTGACVVALGEDIAGVMGQDRTLIEVVRSSGLKMGELFWELPLYLPYTEQLKTEIADLKNIGKRWGGAITGALFLKEFVPDEIPWVHADIAGPAVKEEPLGHLGKGAKGFGVKTLYETARRLAEESPNDAQG